MPSISELTQFAIATAWGCLFFWWVQEIENESAGPIVMALAFGYVMLKVTMFVYVLFRFGWQAARSIKLFGND